MSGGSWREEVGGPIRVEQIVVGAMLFGVVLFLAIATVLVFQGISKLADDDRVGQILNLVLAVFLVGGVAARLIAPSVMVSAARRRITARQWQLPAGQNQAAMGAMIERSGDAGRLVFVHLQKTIVAVAILEGAAFFATIVFMITQSTFSLVAACFLIAALAMHFPTRSSVTHWIEDQLQLVEQERALGGH